MPSFVSLSTKQLNCCAVLLLLLAALAPAASHAQSGSGPAAGAMMLEGVWQLPESVDHLLWVELDAGRLNVLERSRGGDLLIRRQIPVSIGKQGYGKQEEGDQLTPVGIYRLTSFLSDTQLDDKYGHGAYTLNYPNPHDMLSGLTGHGIWLHGLPKGVERRPLLDSDGCVVIDNASLRTLGERISTGVTHIVLSPGPLKWVEREVQEGRKRGLVAAIGAWKRAWESKDNTGYLGYYAEEFSDLRRDKTEWASYKTRVNSAKRYISLDFSEMSMLVHPEDDDLVTVRYYQDYRSDNYTWSGWKEQLWRRSPEGWHILYEGNG